jgi:hypothetical protein
MRVIRLRKEQLPQSTPEKKSNQRADAEYTGYNQINHTASTLNELSNRGFLEVTQQPPGTIVPFPQEAPNYGDEKAEQEEGPQEDDQRYSEQPKDTFHYLLEIACSNVLA